MALARRAMSAASCGIEVGPRRVLFAGQVGAFGNEQVGVRRQEHGVLAYAGVRAVGDDLAVQIEAIAQTGRGVHQEAAVQGEGQLVGPGRELADLHRVGQLVQGDGEGLVDNSIQNLLRALLAEDGQAWVKRNLLRTCSPSMWSRWKWLRKR